MKSFSSLRGLMVCSSSLMLSSCLKSVTIASSFFIEVSLRVKLYGNTLKAIE